MIKLWLIFLWISSISLVACEKSEQENPTNAKLVASVGSRALYATDLRRIIHPSTSVQDSIALATAYIDQWVRDQLMTREAAKHFSTDFEIEKLVDDYRENLLKFNLEEQIINARYDTIVTEEELNSFYDQMKEQFFLKEDIYRCIFARFKRGTPGLDSFKKDWREENMSLIVNFANAFSEEAKMDTTKWYTWTEIKGWSASLAKSIADQSGMQIRRDAEYEYFLKIEDHVDKEAVSPLEYIKPQLIRMLLHKRKQWLLEDYKQELYEKALNQNIIKLP